MARLERIRKRMENILLDQYDAGRLSRRGLAQEMAHLNGVIVMSRHLALLRGYSSELAAVAGALHDLGRFQLGVYGKEHASQGAKQAVRILKDSGDFSKSEIGIIRDAIKTHNRKGKYGHGPYNEILKDADLLSRYFEETDQIFGANKIRRLMKLKQELYHGHTATAGEGQPAGVLSHLQAVFQRQGGA